MAFWRWCLLMQPWGGWAVGISRVDASGRVGWDKGPDGLVYVGAQILKTERIAPSEATLFAGRNWNDMMAKGV
jgi:hypothetical protein